MGKKMKALVDLRCGYLGKCVKGGITGELLPRGEENTVKFYCRGCMFLETEKIILFGYNLKVGED